MKRYGNAHTKSYGTAHGKRYGKSVAAAGVCAVFALAGCSGPDSGSGAGGGKSAFEGKSADAIAQEAAAAMKTAKSFRTVTDGKQRGQRTRMEIAFAGDGRCTTTLDLPEIGRVESVTVGGASYSKGGPAFMKMALGSETAAKEAAGRWVKGAQSDSTCKRDTLVNPAAMKGATRGADAEVDGRRTATLEMTAQDNKVTMHVAAEGKPYVLRIVTEGALTSTATFSSYDRPLEIKAPPAAQVVEAKAAAQQPAQ
ncbi:hypothetical protein SAMN05421806_11467 [Streptomyces indicus]|uniref:Lipoprotein n=2 Tax=Streptomyces indicus TaxID=417292 RepID=A0A1G9FU83_9ACTN|nr:hypothetical protein SAMN05421806_11467 [Streptomyces indicus]